MNDIQYVHFKEKIEQLRFQNPEEQKAICLALLETSKQQQDSYGIFLATIYLLDYNLAIRNSEQCQYYMSEGLYHIDDHHLEDVSQFYILCGIFCFMNNDTHTAIDYYCKAMHLCEEQHNYERIAGIYNNIALIFHTCDAIEEALNYYSMAYDLMVEHGLHYLKRNLSIMLGDIISCYQQLGDLEYALQYFEHLKKHEIYSSMQTCLQANISYLKHDYEHVIQYCLETYDSLQKEYLDKHLIYTIHEDIVKLMLLVGNQQQIFDAIERFYHVCNMDNTNERLIILRYYMQYVKRYRSKDELIDLYLKYYELHEKHEKIKKEAHATSYRDQLLLDKMIRLNTGLKTSATYDSVTKLKNRNAFEYDIKQFTSNPSISCLSLMMCDVDNFKEHNDHFGHVYGDKILHQVGDILSQYVEDNFLAYRFGGDEFLCLGVNKDKLDMEAYIQHIFSQIKKHPSIKISAGYTCLKTNEIQNYVDLIDAADKALYKAKREGKNCYKYNR